VLYIRRKAGPLTSRHRHMRVAITADLHVNNDVYKIRDVKTGLMLRTMDSFRALDFFVDKAIELEVDRVVAVGDIYHNHYPTSDIRRMFAERMQKLVNAGIQTVLMVGNHDACRDHHALMPLKGWNKLLKVVDAEVVELDKDDDYAAIYIPHTNAVERKEVKFPELVRTVTMGSKFPEPCLFFGHFGVTGAMKNDIRENTNRADVSVADIEATGATVAFLGHYHKHQAVKGNIPIHYVGSLERHRMDELNGKRGFYIYDTDTQESEWVEYDGCRPMARIVATSFEEAMDDIEEGDWTGHICAVDLEGDEKQYAYAKGRLAELQAAFERRGGVHLLLYDKSRQEDRDGDDVDIKSADDIDVHSILKKHVEEDFAEDDDERGEHLGMLDDLWKKATTKK